MIDSVERNLILPYSEGQRTSIVEIKISLTIRKKDYTWENITKWFALVLKNIWELKNRQENYV